MLSYLKCSFVPLVAAGLAWFVVRLYLNDLYISIPDRLLAASALALLVQVWIDCVKQGAVRGGKGGMELGKSHA